MVTGQSDEGIFLTKVPSSQITTAYVKLAEKQQKTNQHTSTAMGHIVFPPLRIPFDIPILDLLELFLEPYIGISLAYSNIFLPPVHSVFFF